MNKVKYVAYHRVSTHKQGVSGLGLESQKQIIEEFVSARDAVLLDEFTEVESGKSSDRPELEKALGRCMLTGATLIIAKLDRLSRDVEFIAKMQKSRIDFLCCDMPEANSFTINMMASLAQYERELISERTKAGLEVAKSRGKTLGNPHLHVVRNTCTKKATAKKIENTRERDGYVMDVINTIEADHLERTGETMSYRQLAKALNDTQSKTTRGNNFTHVQVMRIKKRAAVG